MPDLQGGDGAARVVIKYIGQQRLTLRDFADALSERLGDGQKLTHPTVINWRDGNTQPETDLLILIALRYADWRRDFALDVLAAKKPEIWGENGGIWDLGRPK